MVDIAEIDARAACIGNGFEYVYEQLHLYTLMKRRCGVKQGLRKCWFHLQNEIQTRWGGLQKRDTVGSDVHHIYEHIDVTVWKTRPIMVEKCQNLRNEIKPRWGDSVNLVYRGHRTNKSRRYPPLIYVEHVF